MHFKSLKREDFRRVGELNMGCEGPGETYKFSRNEEFLKFELGPAYKDVRANRPNSGASDGSRFVIEGICLRPTRSIAMAR